MSTQSVDNRISPAVRFELANNKFSNVFTVSKKRLLLIESLGKIQGKKHSTLARMCFYGLVDLTPLIGRRYTSKDTSQQGCTG